MFDTDQFEPSWDRLRVSGAVTKTKRRRAITWREAGIMALVALPLAYLIGRYVAKWMWGI